MITRAKGFPAGRRTSQRTQMPSSYVADVGPFSPHPREHARRDRIVFVSAGDNHRIPEDWSESNHFSLCVVFYGDNEVVAKQLAHSADVFHRRKGGKFQNLQWLWSTSPELFDEVDAVFAPDDDVDITEQEVHRLFETRARYDIWILGVTQRRSGACRQPLSLRAFGSSLRFTTFVEVGVPLFRSDKLADFINEFDGSLTGFGIDSWYMNFLGEWQPHRYALTDEISFVNPHSRGELQEREIRLLVSKEAEIRDFLGAFESKNLHDEYHVVTHAVGRTPLSTIREAWSFTLETTSMLRRAARHPRLLLRNTSTYARRKSNQISGCLSIVRLRSSPRLENREKAGLAPIVSCESLCVSVNNAYTGSDGCARMTAKVLSGRVSGESGSDGPILCYGGGPDAIATLLRICGTDTPIEVLDCDPENVRKARVVLRLAGFKRYECRFSALEHRQDKCWFADDPINSRRYASVVCEAPLPHRVRGGRSALVDQLEQATQLPSRLILLGHSEDELAELTKSLTSRLPFEEVR